VSHFHLNPTQCKIPNDRPRYFTIAVLLGKIEPSSPLNVDEVRRKKIECVHLNEWFSRIMEKDQDDLEECPPIQKSIDPLNVQNEGNDGELLEISSFLDDESANNKRSELFVPQKVLKSNSSWCFDVVAPSDRRSACFTSSYGRFIRGTGSVIVENLKDSTLEKIKLVPPEDRTFESEWAKELEFGDLRYFSGTELARLFGFPVTVNPPEALSGGAHQFRFPPDCTLKQQFKLMGNSLNVRVASMVCETALRLVISKSAPTSK
jgi:tRNA (cytosine38-C5)-methyltransferase